MNHCNGKHKFPTYNVAQASLGFKRGDPMKVLHCPHCQFYHVIPVTPTQPDFRRAK
jgi:hypothetical protein